MNIIKVLIFIGIIYLSGLLISAIQEKTAKSQKTENNINENQYDSETTSYNTTTQYNYSNSYEPKYLMTINEKNQYRKLQKWAYNRNLIVFTKVRLLDLITPRKNQENYKGALWKIQAKHVDFVICDQDIRIKCIIEITDNSHNKSERIERDNFVIEVLQACGYKVLITHNIIEEQLDNFCGYNQSTT